MLERAGMFIQAPPRDPDVQSLQMQGSSWTWENWGSSTAGSGVAPLGKGSADLEVKGFSASFP